MNQEKFKLWKLALSIIHIDGKVTPKEKEWFDSSIEKLTRNQMLSFSNDQIEELKQCLHIPAKKLVEEFKSLQKPSDRSILLHIIKIACHADNEFSPAEQDIYNELKEACHANIDIDKITAKTEEMEEESYHEDEVYKCHTDSLGERLFMFIVKSLNRGDSKFPKSE